MESQKSRDSRKAEVINELRKKYEDKFGNTELVKDTLEDELSRLKHKSKLSMHDLNEIETKLTSASHTNSVRTLTSNHDIGSYNKMPPIDLSPSPHKTHQKTYSVNVSPTRYYSPLKSDRILNSTKSYAPSPYQQPSPYRTPGVDAFSPFSSKDHDFSTHQSSRYIGLITDRVNTDKTELYHRKQKDNIWGMIENHQYQEHIKQQEDKQKKYQQKKDLWLANITEQYNTNTKNKQELKMRTVAEEEEFIQEDIRQKEEVLMKQRRRMEENDQRKKVLYHEGVEELKVKKHMTAQEKKDDAQWMADRIKKEQETIAQEKERIKRMQKEYHNINSNLVNQKQNREFVAKTERKEKDEIAVMYQMTQLEKQDTDNQEFYDRIRTRAIKQPDPSPKKGDDSLRTPKGIENEAVQQNLLSFVNSKPDSTQQMQMKRERQMLLQQIYKKQMDEKEMRDGSYKKIIEDQSKIWRADRELFELEKLVSKQQETRKMHQFRNDIQQQMAENKAGSLLPFSAKELWINRKVLKKIGYEPNGAPINLDYTK